MKYGVHMLVGKPWEAISDYAGGMLGSVAHGVAQRSPVPVVFVK